MHFNRRWAADRGRLRQPRAGRRRRAAAAPRAPAQPPPPPRAPSTAAERWILPCPGTSRSRPPTARPWARRRSCRRVPGAGTLASTQADPAHGQSGCRRDRGTVRHPVQRARGLPAGGQIDGATDASCHLTWPVLAGIGKVESGPRSRRRAGRERAHPLADPRPRPFRRLRIAAIHDTDGGRWDGDTVWDRAVGPMQFIPSSWRSARRRRQRRRRRRPEQHLRRDAGAAAATSAPAAAT